MFSQESWNLKVNILDIFKSNAEKRKLDEVRGGEASSEISSERKLDEEYL